MRKGLVTVGCAVLLSGCGAQNDPQPAIATVTPTLTYAVPSATPGPKQPPGTRLRFRATDGRKLSGRLSPAGEDPAPAVVLVHQFQGGPDQWDPLVPILHRAGFTTLAYASRSADELDESRLARDVRGAIDALREQPSVDPDKILLVGASIGASTVTYVLGTDDDGALGGVALSGATSPIFEKLKAIHPHGLLLIADEREQLGSEDLVKLAHGRGVTSYVSAAAGHGVALLDEPPVVKKLLGWLGRLAA